MILRHQLLDVRQNQHTSAGEFGQFGDNQTFSCPRRQYDNGWLGMTTEIFKRSGYSLTLVRP